MTNFTDFALAGGIPKVTLLSEFKRHQHDKVTDFYRPIRETIVDVHRRRLDGASAFGELMDRMTDLRTVKIFPAIIEGHTQFVDANRPLTWFKPASAMFPAGPGVAIAINPEVGLTINGLPHHVKLYLRSETLTQKRVDLTVALMSNLATKKNEKLAVLDVRNAALHYLSPKGASAGGWRRLTALVAIEAAGYAAGWRML